MEITFGSEQICMLEYLLVCDVHLHNKTLKLDVLSGYKLIRFWNLLAHSLTCTHLHFEVQVCAVRDVNANSDDRHIKISINEV